MCEGRLGPSRDHAPGQVQVTFSSDLQLTRPMQTLLVTMLTASASAFSAGHVRLPAASRSVTPSMQFGKKKDAPPKAGAKGKAGGKSGGFYDDEIDTVSKPAWRFDANDNIAENGEVDLANVGGVRSFPPSLPACFGLGLPALSSNSLPTVPSTVPSSHRRVLPRRRALLALLPRVRLRRL